MSSTSVLIFTALSRWKHAQLRCSIPCPGHKPEQSKILSLQVGSVLYITVATPPGEQIGCHLLDNKADQERGHDQVGGQAKIRLCDQGTIVRSNLIIAPTNALIRTRIENHLQLALDTGRSTRRL